MRRVAALAALGIAAAVAAPAPAQTGAAARATAVAADWRTPAEVSGYRTTPRYDETMAYLRRLAAAAPRTLRIETFGKTGEGRDLVVVVASRDGVFDPAAIHRAGRPVVLVQNAIHAGEMDGKDACLALLRDMLITGARTDLLRRAVVVIIPIYNADGHERFGPHNRINQNGPEEMGWRTQSRNLNLNRDYVKADAPETRAFLKLWNRWQPDFFVDDHVTDGADYAYDTTYAIDSGPDVVPAIAAWVRDAVIPHLEESVARAGHAIAPYIALRDDTDPARGLGIGQDQPRYSTGYAVLRNRPGLLVEMHMLKDYRTRVTGNHALLVAALEVIDRDAARLVAINRDADAATIAAGAAYDPVARAPLRLEADESTEPFVYRSNAYRREASDISGGTVIRYTDEPGDLTVPRQTRLRVTRAVAPPRAYIVPAQWTDVIGVLAAHGLRLRRTTRPWTAAVDTYRCDEVRWLERPFEGRQVLFYPGGEGLPKSSASPGICRPMRETMTFPAGSAVVPLDQPAAKVAIHFLEPEAPDSAVAWGFFNAIFEQKEYAEPYVMEPLARDMLAKDPALAKDFAERLAADAAFAASPEARLNFFYLRSPWRDPHLGLYPVGRLTTLDGVPLAK
jgi:hypothetical protein